MLRPFPWDRLPPPPPPPPPGPQELVTEKKKKIKRIQLPLSKSFSFIKTPKVKPAQTLPLSGLIRVKVFILGSLSTLDPKPFKSNRGLYLCAPASKPHGDRGGGDHQGEGRPIDSIGYAEYQLSTLPYNL